MFVTEKERAGGLERCWGQVRPDLAEGAARSLTQEQEKVEGTQGQAGLGGKFWRRCHSLGPGDGEDTTGCTSSRPVQRWICNMCTNVCSPSTAPSVPPARI